MTAVVVCCDSSVSFKLAQRFSVCDGQHGGKRTLGQVNLTVGNRTCYAAVVEQENILLAVGILCDLQGNAVLGLHG